MKIKLILLLTMFLALCSCTNYPEQVEQARYELESSSQLLIPYQKGEKINFIHSKGYAFDFTVAEDTITWSNNKSIYDRSSIDYYDSFQLRTVELRSDYPDFLITFKVSAEPGKKTFEMWMNYYRSYILYDEQYKLVPDTANGQKLHESILINNKTYNNVIEISMGENKALFYNEEQGLLQIKTSEDETFSINN